MTDKKLRHTKKTIREYLDRWLRPLGLLWWEINIVYYDDPETVYEKFYLGDEDYVLARTHVKWMYGSALIEFNLLDIKRYLKEADIERLVVHELCHILVNEMREEGIEHEERVVTGLAKAFMWTKDTHDRQ